MEPARLAAYGTILGQLERAAWLEAKDKGSDAWPLGRLLARVAAAECSIFADDIALRSKLYAMGTASAREYLSIWLFG